MRHNKLWRQYLIERHSRGLSEAQVVQVREFIQEKIANMPMKIAGDSVTLRLSGQEMRLVDLALYQIMCSVVFSLDVAKD